MSSCSTWHWGDGGLCRRIPVFTSLISLFMTASLLGVAGWGRAAGTDSELQEVVVSATRQGQQSIQSVPMAISVISPSSLEDKGLDSLSDFARLIPSVNIQSESGGVNSIEMRGLTTGLLDATNSQERSLTALYLDDVSLALQPFNPDLKAFDLERIEVLKGPQGTLYGAGSMSGTIRLITKKPDPNSFSGSGDLSVSVTDHGSSNYSLRGLVNLPLIENKLALRLSGYRGDDSGYINNIGTGQAKANDTYTTQSRVAIRWLPSDTVTIDVTSTIARLDSLGTNQIYPELGNYTTTSLTRQRFDDFFKLGSLTVAADLSFATLTSSTSYINRTLQYQTSYEFLQEAIVTPGLQLPASNIDANEVHSATEELRLVSRPDQRLRWIAGAYFEHVHRYFPQFINSPGFDAVVNPGETSSALYGTPLNDQSFYGTIDYTERQVALFGEATYAVTPTLDVTLGARYFDFKEDFDLAFTGVLGALAPGQPLADSGTQKSKGANPRAVISFKPVDGLMIYAEAARGFRYGGVNEPAPPQFCSGDLNAIGLSASPPTFGPDHLWSYTLGEKSTFADNRFTVDVDGFFIDWKDVQTVHILPSCGYYFQEDKGSVTSQGLEFEANARVTHDLTLGVSASYTDAKANGSIANLNAADGDRAPYFPRTIATAMAEYSIEVGRGKVIFGTDFTYRSNAYTQFSPGDPLYREIPCSKMLNITANYKRDRWSVGLFATNLTNDRQVSLVEGNVYAPYQPGDAQTIGRPLTFGGRVHVDF
jgi:iron complex outermembrane receptor protein